MLGIFEGLFELSEAGFGEGLHVGFAVGGGCFEGLGGFGGSVYGYACVACGVSVGVAGWA